ncbi:MAG: NADH-quinone oxidoreductase subunit M, partial [Deltaproteobacteria bacterium]|nr:NADH-quinone oxidoreductase subunit M [Deltaproteobacteria bacterium]
MEKYLIFNALNYPIITVLLVVPLIGAVFTLFLKKKSLLRVWGLAVTFLTAALSLPLYFNFDLTTPKYQFVELGHWFPSLHLNYVVGVDGISVLLVMLTTFIMPLCILCSWTYIKERFKEFVIVILIIETTMIGVFVSL